jgi:hypothetical protein
VNANEEISIDSLKIRIPYDEKLVTVTDPHFFDVWYWFNPKTANYTHSSENRPIYKQFKRVGYSFDITYKNRQIAGVTRPFLYFNLSAKILEKNYFEGITLGNIRSIYDRIMALGVCEFSYDTFLNRSNCTDIDFKKDYQTTDTEFRKQINVLKKSSKMSNKSTGFSSYSGGLTWNKRAKADKSNPFCKIYNKEVEMNLPRNQEFKDAYFLEEDFQGLRRIEFTVKDANHISSLGIPDTKLRTILSLSQAKKEEMLAKSFGAVLLREDFQIETHINQDLTPNDVVLLNSLRQVLKGCGNIEVAVNLLTEGLKGSNLCKKKKLFMNLYGTYLKKEFTTTEDLNNPIWGLLQFQN